MCLPLFQGKLESTLVNLDRCASEDLRNQDYQSYMNIMSLSCLLLVEKGQSEQAWQEFDRALEQHQQNTGSAGLGRPLIAIQLLTAKDMAAARTYLENLDAKTETRVAEQKHKFWFCKGWAELCEDKPESAIESFTRAAEITDKFYIRYPLALAYLKSRQPGKAIDEFESALADATDERVRFALWNVKAHYYLGLAYLENGQPDKALHHINIFLDKWKNADWAFEEMAAARAHSIELAKTVENP
jgi:tetratricopeptide (TPR) repeat protein